MSATPPAYPDHAKGADRFGSTGNGSSGPAAELLRYGASLATSNSKKPQKLFAPRLLHYIAEAEACLLKQQSFADGAREPEDPHMP